MVELRTVRIADFGRVVTGKTPPSAQPELFGELYPFLTPTDIDGFARYIEPDRFLSPEGGDYQHRLMLPERAVCVVCIGATIGKVCMTGRPSFTNQQINSVVVNEDEHDPFFVYNLLTTLRDELKSNAGGAATPIINKTAFSEIEVSVPPLPVQRRIAGILSAYDELMENNQRRIRILEAMARALYREWFVHFRFPGYEKLPRLASPLGDIPKGWEIKAVGEIAETFRGRSYRSVDLAEDGGLPFLNLKCLDRDGGFRRSGLKRYKGEYKASHIAKKGDIVMAVTDMTQDRAIIARAALVPSLDNDFGVCSMDLVRIEPRPALPKTYLYSFLRFSGFADEVKQHANGANVLHLAPERITGFRFPLPPVDLMNRFAAFAAPTLEQIDTLENKIQNLRRTRDLLLPRLLSGQTSLTTKENHATA